MSGQKKEIPDTDLRLKKEQRDRLKETYGEIIEGDLPERYCDKDPIVAVGDVVTDILLKQGVVPNVSTIDHKTRRGGYKSGTSKKDAFDIEFDIKNPPEMISRPAWIVMEKALKKEKTVLIEVEGEEDLLSLVAIILCPSGGLVIYGVPSEGMVINEVSEEFKEKAWEVINNMIKVNEGR